MIDRATFCRAFVPMAIAGKSALEIGQHLNIEGSDKEVSQKVSQKAANYRKELRVQAEAAAKNDGLDTEATIALVNASVARMPKLSTRTREKVENFASFLDDLFAEADPPAKTPKKGG